MNVGKLEDESSNEGLLILTLLSVLFFFISVWFFKYLEVVNEKTISKYFIIISSTAYITFLYAVSKYNIKGRYKILIAAISILTMLSISHSNYIEKIAVKLHYEIFETIIIGNNKDAKNTNIYKKFKIDKDQLDKEKIAYYFKNIDNYKSINREEVVKLKILYTLTTNLEIKNKLDELFKEEIISINKYNEFQDFIYSMKLSNNEIVHLSFINNKFQ